MLPMRQIREDLKEIRHYYTMKKTFDMLDDTLRPVALLNKVQRYNSAMQNAPAKIYIIYAILYLQNTTQAVLADEWGYSREYIKLLNQKLCEYLQKTVI